MAYYLTQEQIDFLGEENINLFTATTPLSKKSMKRARLKIRMLEYRKDRARESAGEDVVNDLAMEL